MLMFVFTVEAIIRATNEAMNEAGGGSLIKLEVAHLEKVVITSYIYCIQLVSLCNEFLLLIRYKEVGLLKICETFDVL